MKLMYLAQNKHCLPSSVSIFAKSNPKRKKKNRKEGAIKNWQILNLFTTEELYIFECMYVHRLKAVTVVIKSQD